MSRVTTIYGAMDESDLRKTISVLDDAKEVALVLEYRRGDEVVHRSAAVILKEPSEVLAAIVGNTGG